jgi:hypothetical protein
MTTPHRTPEMKAKYAADEHVRSQKELDELLTQFLPEHRQTILDRLTPHLTFEPEPLGWTPPEGE